MEEPLKRTMRECRMEAKGRERKTKNVKSGDTEEDAKQIERIIGRNALTKIDRNRFSVN
jgi:hypothetical protein